MKNKIAKDKFVLGQRVIVNTGGNDTEAIIDYPTMRKDINGKERSHVMKTGIIAYCCRFTTDWGKCWVGGAKNDPNSGKAEDHTLFTNAQFIPEEYIRPATP